jgi:phosphate/sulfate permease
MLIKQDNMHFFSIFKSKILSPLLFCIISVLLAVILNIYFKEEIKTQKLFSEFQK